MQRINTKIGYVKELKHLLLDKECQLCGLKCEHRFRSGLLGLSMQRINTKVGYIKENVIPYCLACNLLLQDYSYDQVEGIFKYLLSSPPKVLPQKQALSKHEQQVLKGILAYQKLNNEAEQVCLSLEQLSEMASSHRFCSLSKFPGVWTKGHVSRLTFDRIVPGYDGGKYETSNVQVINKHLNIVKSIYPMEQLVTWFNHFKTNKPEDLLARLWQHNASVPSL